MLSLSRPSRLYARIFLPLKAQRGIILLRLRRLRPNLQLQKAAGNSRRKRWTKRSQTSIKGMSRSDIDGRILIIFIFDNRSKDLSSQNNILHQHLESVSTQAARIRQAAGAASEAQATETEGTEDTDAKLAELRSVVSWLRREKGIVDLQLQLSSDENARFKRQIEHLSKSLQETQAMLSEVSFSNTNTRVSYLKT